MRVEVKICGLTRPEDVEAAARLGSDYLGFNFSAASRRRVPYEAAGALADAAGESARRVGVFVDESAAEVRSAIRAARLQVLQFHRDLRESDLDFGLPVVAVCRLGSGAPKLPESSLLERCAALLFDSFDSAKVGGTGQMLPRGAVVPPGLPVPIWIAGGLSAENVESAIRTYRPRAVDVASGVESRPGAKDVTRMTRFIEAVRRAET